ncbi:2-keto-4-pentenoate hydratase [Alkalihalobacillus sp. TS-13]|uniref:2-keto-4-pentenoate hydratase n=1 Tax=Alkalihalobacillus sp. TS-13 TaxID=2842455 RepID=UPI001C881545|nr:2-keto-4-pentenoate hydratase [Alkalihalobacillus sp. TS-13]
MTERVKELSEHLVTAVQNRKGVQPLTEVYPDLSIDEAYQVQLSTIKRKTDSGQRIVGKKIGLTSKAMQDLLGVGEPDYGHLLDDMVIDNGDEIPADKVLQPKVEAEIAFVLRKDLHGPNVTADDVYEATAYVVPALEIVDSRVADWKIKLPDTIADNASSGLYVLGENKVPIRAVDLPAIKMDLYKNEEPVNSGMGAAALENPANCVAWLANKLSDYGVSLKAGEVILSGALSAAVDAMPGDTFRATFDALGEVTVRFNG